MVKQIPEVVESVYRSESRRVLATLIHLRDPNREAIVEA